MVYELNKNMGGLVFGIDGDGNRGYYGADGSLVPFSQGLANIGVFSIDHTVTAAKDGTYAIYSDSLQHLNFGYPQYSTNGEVIREEYGALENIYGYRVWIVKLKKGQTFTTSRPTADTYGNTIVFYP